jgi:hypothetical protein
MTAPPPRRPWWKRKRAWAAGALWLAVAYPLSMGPIWYCTERGWLSDPAVRTCVELYVAPLFATAEAMIYAAEAVPRLVRLALDGFDAYGTWWVELGRRHTASD